MLKLLNTLLNVEKGEEKPVLLLLLYGFFMGIFFSAYRAVSETLFLSQLSAYITEAMFASGLFGIVCTGLYAWAQRRFNYSKLVNLNLVLIFIFIAGTRLMVGVTGNDWMVFLLYIMYQPIFAICMLSFWGVFGRMFDLRQSKRIIGGIDAGQLIATIIGLFSIPFLQNYFKDIIQILNVGEVALLGALITLVVITRKFKLGSYHAIKGTRAPKESSFKYLFKNKYIVLLSTFLFLSMLVYSFVHFSFLSVTSIQYNDENKLLTFVSVIHGSVLFVSLLMQTFVNEKLISMYGLKTSLLLLPLVLFVFICLSMGAGFVFGFTVASPDFVYFFLFITLSYLLASILREALESPVFKIFFMPINPRFRFDIQTRVEGMVNELARLVSGAMIFGLGMIPVFRLIDFNTFLIFLIIPYFLLVFVIYRYYHQSIKRRLEEQKEDFEDQVHHDISQIRQMALSERSIESVHELIFILKILARYSPEQFKEVVSIIRNEENNQCGQLAILSLQDDITFLHLTGNYDDKDPNSSGKLLDLKAMVKSKDSAERKNVAELIGLGYKGDTVKLLNELLSDQDPAVIKSAITAAGKTSQIELLPLIIDYLQQKEFMDDAAIALINFGSEAFPVLDVIFYGKEENVLVKLKILGIYGRVGGDEALKLLWNKIEFPDYKVIYKVLYELSRCSFKADFKQRSKIKKIIEEDIEVYLINIMTIRELNNFDKTYENQQLIQALEEENKQRISHVFMLLEMIFDRDSILLAKENIEKGTGEGTNNALELLDIILTEDLQHRVISLLDDVSYDQKIEKLRQFYPVEVSNNEVEILINIINRDYNKANRYTKARALLQLAHTSPEPGSLDTFLMANLFNPDKFIFMATVQCVQKINPSLLPVYKSRLINKAEDKLSFLPVDNALKNAVNLINTLDLIAFFREKTTFGGLSGLFLSNLTEETKLKHFEQNLDLPLAKWDKEIFFWIYKGSIVLVNNADNNQLTFSEGVLITEEFTGYALNGDYQLIIPAETTILTIDKQKFYELITEDLETLLAVAKVLEQFKKEIKHTLILEE
ncbi:MAG: hypothetical protein ACFCUU_01435 [Cyclobacteriaceae bacterium]